jgi:tRNA pseudouridine55 synthase
MNLEKEYQFDVRLGVETDTLDVEGRVTREAPCPDFTEKQVHEVAESFIGEYDLTPPAFSALKINGRRMYEMARAGESPKVGSRKVRIYDFKVMSFERPVVTCLIRCSRGTYVRSLARDFGEKLQVPAHIDNIIRKRIGPFDDSAGFPSDKLFEKDVSDLRGSDLSRALDFLPAVILDEKARKALRYGMLPNIRDVVGTIGEIERGGPLRILDGDGVLVAIGQRNRGKRRSPLQLVDSYRLCIDTSQNKKSTRAS